MPPHMPGMVFSTENWHGCPTRAGVGWPAAVRIARADTAYTRRLASRAGAVALRAADRRKGGAVAVAPISRVGKLLVSSRKSARPLTTPAAAMAVTAGLRALSRAVARSRLGRIVAAGAHLHGSRLRAMASILKKRGGASAGSAVCNQASVSQRRNTRCVRSRGMLSTRSGLANGSSTASRSPTRVYS